MGGDESLSPAPNTSQPAAAVDQTDVLNNNMEYMLVYRAIEVLRSQLTRAKSDMQQLEALRASALRDPAQYVTALVANTGPKAPAPQTVCEVPSVHMEPYLSCADPVSLQTYMTTVRPGDSHERVVTRPRSGRMAWSARSSARVSRQPSLVGVSRMAVTAAPSVRATPSTSPAPVATPVTPVTPVAPAAPAPRVQPSTTATNTATDDGNTDKSRGQKTLTPQMLAEFRRQASERSASPEAAEPPPVKRKRGRPPKPGGPTERKRLSQALGTKARARGPTRRVEGGARPASFNVPWSDAEQQRLEQLLGEFPEEEVANNRWRKISEALGTRTMRQVASRVQKYFIKLAKAGLPVPGRAPDTSQWADARDEPRPPRRPRDVDFTSSEDDDYASDDGGYAAGESSGVAAGTSSVTGSTAAAADRVPSTPGPQFQTPALQSAKAVHLGYRCDSCSAEPIVGIRWHCQDCHGAQTVDLCDDCMEEGAYETPWHTHIHNFHAYRDAEMEPYYASEVGAPALREFSYLA